MNTYTLESFLEDDMPKQPEYNAIDIAIESLSQPMIPPSAVAEKPKDFEPILDVLENFQGKELTEETLTELNAELAKADVDFDGEIKDEESLKAYRGEIQMGVIDSLKKFGESIKKDWDYWRAKSKDGWAAYKDVMEQIKKMEGYEPKSDTIKLSQAVGSGIVTADGDVVNPKDLAKLLNVLLASFKGGQKRILELAQKTDEDKLLEVVAKELSLHKVWEKKDRGEEQVGYGVYPKAYQRTLFVHPLTVVMKNTHLKASPEIKKIDFPTLSLKDIEELMTASDNAADEINKLYVAEGRQLEANIKELNKIADDDLPAYRSIMKKMHAADNLLFRVHSGFWDISWGLFNYGLASFRNYARK